ncbi:MAG: endonuclease III domain-containing protein [Deltaproteobacteria bacterium]|nr:endonuclease III domain-containing protein [Deltaproteobacteria bacterium]
MVGQGNRYIEVYDLLYAHFGSQDWWPAETPFEVMVGAILTQNTNWINVTKAINNLRRGEMLGYSQLLQLPIDHLAEYIRPSGYYNLKAGRLHNLLDMINSQYGGDLDQFLEDDVAPARENLLSVKGIGPETADSILLEETDYHTMQTLFMDHLPVDVQLYNEFHALIVLVAKQFCKKTKPLCDQCPLQGVNL